MNNRTTDPIYLDSLSTTGQKNWNTFKIIPPTPASCNLNTRPPWLTLSKSALKSICMNKHNFTTLVQFLLTSTDGIQKSITGTQILPVRVLVRWQKSWAFQKATKMQRDQFLKNLKQNCCIRNRPIVADYRR